MPEVCFFYLDHPWLAVAGGLGCRAAWGRVVEMAVGHRADLSPWVVEVGLVAGVRWLGVLRATGWFWARTWP